MEEKVGEVKRKPFGALKRICEENSMAGIVGNFLPRYQKIVNNVIENAKNKDIQSNKNTPMFTDDTKQELGIGDIVGALREEEMIRE